MAKRRGTAVPRTQETSNRDGGLVFDELLIQPWFLTQRVQLAIRSLVPPSYRERMRNLFDDYGCMICGSYERYEANGMCMRCNHTVRRKLRASARRRMKTGLARRIDMDLLRQTKLAIKLLGRFSPKNRKASQRRRIDTAHSRNPVDEMLTWHPR